MRIRGPVRQNSVESKTTALARFDVAPYPHMVCLQTHFNVLDVKITFIDTCPTQPCLMLARWLTVFRRVGTVFSVGNGLRDAAPVEGLGLLVRNGRVRVYGQGVQCCCCKLKSEPTHSCLMVVGNPSSRSDCKAPFSRCTFAVFVFFPSMFSTPFLIVGIISISFSLTRC